LANAIGEPSNEVTFFFCENVLPAIINYVIHLLLASVLLLVFFNVYTYLTPFDEVLLIRQGNNAAAISLAGALIGFSLTVASCLIYTTDYRQFLAWALGAMLVQVLAHKVTSKLLHMSKDQIEAGNTAFGALLGAISLSIGAINAACIS
jgi:putative membrane protein